MNEQFDIAVAWRIYPGVSKTPIIYPADKFELVKTSLRSFLASARDLRIRYFFILDGCPPEYRQLIETLFAGEAFSIIETPAIGNHGTFAKQVELLATQTDAGIVYFAEDDYLYLPGELKHLHAFMTAEKEADFVSGYVAADIFRHPIHQHKRITKYADGKLWFTVNSTCLTFMTRVEVLREIKSLLLTYSKGNNDCAVWLVITKTHILRPFSYMRLMGHRESFGILKMAVKYSLQYFFTTRRYKLWVPFPAVCTHLEKGNESPGIDWIQISKNITRE